LRAARAPRASGDEDRAVTSFRMPRPAQALRTRIERSRMGLARVAPAAAIVAAIAAAAAPAPVAANSLSGSYLAGRQAVTMKDAEHAAE
ncbi:hypothetical protein DF186_17615, partial [Enterococcus hirae]